MKKVQICAMFLILLLLSTTPAQAGMVDKFSRGITNVLTGLGEYWVQYSIYSDQGNPVKTFFGTLVKGTFYTVVRELAGVYDVVTFPIPLPEGYRPLYEPETIFDSFEQMN